MAESPIIPNKTIELRWPQYEVADDDAVFALGVVSINYARFERTHVWMLAAVANMKESQAAVFTARTNASDRANVIETFFQKAEWPDAVGAAIQHYCKAMRTLIENRNVLIHANMVRASNNETGLFRLDRTGNFNAFRASIQQIRQVADALNCAGRSTSWQTRW